MAGFMTKAQLSNHKPSYTELRAEEPVAVGGAERRAPGLASRALPCSSPTILPIRVSRGIIDSIIPAARVGETGIPVLIVELLFSHDVYNCEVPVRY